MLRDQIEVGRAMDEWEGLIRTLMRRGYLHGEDVIRAMRRVPRKKFVPEGLRENAASDIPLPIGYGQTVSAPHS